jgi:tryptophan synthase alpha subunit
MRISFSELRIQRIEKRARHFAIGQSRMSVQGKTKEKSEKIKEEWE